ncbi:MAG: hypothetical protein HKN21_07635, partial [Candidatus Eisenbacteria bacterium]|nr:hypothetical protein [Candidatus Eisenbacteria bacterium]
MLPSSGGFKRCVAFVCALFATPAIAIAAEVETVTLRYNPSEFVVEATSGFVDVQHPALVPALVDAQPILPREQLTFAAPEGMRLVSVRAYGQVATTLQLTEPVRHHQAIPSLATAKPAPNPSPAPPEFSQTLSRHVYGSYMRGKRLEFVEISPIQWDPETNTLQIYDSVQLELTYDQDPETPLTPRDVHWGEDSFARAAGQLFYLENETASNNLVNLQSNGMEPFSPKLRPTEDGSAVRFLIITDDVMAPEFQELADRRTALGFPAVVRTLSWIRANYDQGFDVAEDVRNFIKEAVANWGVEYVLIGGDPDHVPIRYAKSYYFGGEDIPTDMYYQCLDGNWNADGDELFGEAYFSSSFPGDGVDLLPDVWVGRSPVRNAFEAKKAVDKIVLYESSVPTGTSFSTQMLSLGEVLFPQNWTQGDTVIYDGATLAEQAVAIATPTMSAYRMYEDYMSFPGSLPEIKIDVVAQINAGYNLVLHVGHGYRNTMAVGIGGESLTNFDADTFSNGARAGLLYAINCTSSALDFDCIAEHFYRNTNGGFVSSVGSTRLDFPATGVSYQDEFFDLIF